jgi:hypothetical protein
MASLPSKGINPEDENRTVRRNVGKPTFDAAYSLEQCFPF